ncbi:MAG: T9SS type A sorting domain-containing protein [Bacteroidetes bacterium]|nr:T9SS type A sorting domain-containing protein [Bacteroidota bacterium]
MLICFGEVALPPRGKGFFSSGNRNTCMPHHQSFVSLDVCCTLSLLFTRPPLFAMKKLYQTTLFLLSFSLMPAAFATVHVVNALNFFYSPDVITVNTGDTVRFQWVAGSHPTSSTSGDWSSFVFFPLNASQPQFDLVFNNPGTYNYQCDFHVSLGMIGTVVVVGSPTCSTAAAPTGQSNTVLSNRVRLNWTPQAGAVGCQVQGKQVPTGPQPSINVLGATINTTDVPFAAAGAGTTWTWRVCCACSTSPLLLSPFTAFGDTFSIPVAREASMLPVALQLYPNPASEQINVSFQSIEAGETQLSVYNLSGNLMESRVLPVSPGQNVQTLAVADYPTGIYFLQIGADQVRSFEVVR